MSLNGNIGGTWKTLAPRINVGGTWKTPASVWSNIGGTWKQVFVDFLVDLASGFYSANGLDPSSPYTVRAGFRINSSGLFEKGQRNGGALVYSSIENWLEGGSASQADVRIVTSVGSPIGMTSGTWYNCGTTREVYIERAGVGSESWTGTIEFRNASTLAALDSASLDLYVECGNP